MIDSRSHYLEIKDGDVTVAGRKFRISDLRHVVRGPSAKTITAKNETILGTTTGFSEGERPRPRQGQLARAEAPSPTRPRSPTSRRRSRPLEPARCWPRPPGGSSSRKWPAPALAGRRPQPSDEPPQRRGHSPAQHERQARRERLRRPQDRRRLRRDRQPPIRRAVDPTPLDLPRRGQGRRSEGQTPGAKAPRRDQRCRRRRRGSLPPPGPEGGPQAGRLRRQRRRRRQDDPPGLRDRARRRRRRQVRGRLP